jgi:predicted nucleic acid-binding protein
VAVGLDTSVVMRLLVGVPIVQAEAARQRLARAAETGEAVLVTDLVVAESFFALTRHYRLPDAEAFALLERFLAAGRVRVEPEAAGHAIARREGTGIVDRLVHARRRALGATTLTFDRAQSRLEGAVLLGA